MRFSKKASLNLSVNAIVVFVLAFSMLGVGLFVTNLIKENVAQGIKSLDVTELDNPASAEEPITIPKEVQLKKGKERLLKVGYYNVLQYEVENVKLALSECLGQDGTVQLFYDDATTDPFYIMATTEDVGSSEGTGYEIKLMDKTKELDLGEEFPTGTYVCKIVAHDPLITSGDGSLDSPYESKQFFITLTS
ncbi:hypothetical protein HN695_01780 [Candidatus Woesearchaeota archaeon]|jgi:hypothetical protein|nr:hypothetical protein [Candidatus Woesearchaeota archaeon]MBT5273130.1 hypothetical protein [Candidatus Woesearchaeota archaeon]MBT6041637.1 hypothetical protein [Candidatus Woesearchaeota archaeon]MBT6337555.1 hypothetical protein [Candidatus Woesearchaeota archaeon]MBT7927044.1 hypothetical protein [Candidatus Woesearchaeota archaeon]